MKLRRPTRLRRGRLFSAVIVLTVMAVLAVVGVIGTIYTKTRELAAEMTSLTGQRLAAVEPLTDEERELLRTFKNDEHVQRAQALGVSQVEDMREADSLADRRLLVPLTDNQYYSVREMDYAIPYVTPSTKNLLDSLGILFSKELERRGIPPYRFVITSATRTREAQRRLQSSNPNAAALSSHEFGTTVDLHYEDFEYVAENDSVPDGFWISNRLLASLLTDRYSTLDQHGREALKALLGRELQKLQRDGSVLVIYERLQPVYHITLGRRIPTPDIPRASPVRPPAAAATVPSP